jgi:cell division protein FtsZ
MLNHRNIKPRITVIGVGGAGGNAVNNMISANITEVEFVAANTDMQALASSRAHHRIQLGGELTEGLGAGAKPEVGEAAAEAVIEEIGARIFGSHMVFIAAGMGGGTGTGAAHVVARVAKDLGVLAVAVVTKPFGFEGSIRMRNADAGIAALRKHVDTLLVIPNENLFRVSTRNTTITEAFVTADETLYSGLACIIDLIVKDGLIDLDFADVRTVLAGMGTAMMGMGEAQGDNRAVAAAEGAIFNPLIDDVSLRGARHLLLSITSGRDLTLWEVDEAANRVRNEIDPNANIIVGATLDESLGERMRVSIVASGMPRSADRLAITDQSAASSARIEKALPAPVVENFGKRLAEAIGERDPQAKATRAKRRSADKRPAAKTTTEAIADAITPDQQDNAHAADTQPASQARPKRASGSGRSRRASAAEAAAPLHRREFWAAQTEERTQPEPLALPAPSDMPSASAPQAASAQPASPAPMHPMLASARIEREHDGEGSLARLETSPDTRGAVPRPGTPDQADREGFRFLAQRMRLADNDGADPDAPAPPSRAPPDPRLAAPGPLVAFRRETEPTNRETNLLQRLAGLMRSRREA